MIRQVALSIIGGLLLAATQLACDGTGFATSPDGVPAGATAGKVVVKFRPGTSADKQAAVLAAKGHLVEKRIPQLDMIAVQVPPGQTAEEVIAKYQEHPLVEFAEPEVFMEPQLTPNDPWFPNWQIPLQLLSAEAAWDITTGSPGVPIAVLDTGLDYTHYEYVGRAISGYDFADNDPDFYDPHGHGTWAAGVIGAVANNGVGIAGATWDNPIMVLRTAFGLDGVEAMVWATDHGARVISMSFGSYTITSYINACQYAFDHGVVLVGAAGNDGTNLPFYPAAYSTVLAVTGVTSNGEPIGFNWGSWLDLSAPGGGVLTTYRMESDEDGLGFAGGTSIACPFVAAAAGLVLSVNPDLTPTQVMDILRSTADDLGEPGFDVLTGYGRVNFHAAVLAAGDTEPEQDVTPPTAAIVIPTAGAMSSGTTTVLIDASDDVRVTLVELYVDGSFVSGDSVAPHQWAFDTTPLPDGDHAFSAIAYDAAGNSGEAAPVQVLFDNTAPAVNVTSPANGSTVEGTVAVAATASDTNGIARVVFQVDGLAQATVTASPWTWQWDSAIVGNGQHTLTAVAHDTAGNSAASSVSVSVANAAPVTETFQGSVNNRGPEQTFQIAVTGSGTLTAQLTFGGRWNTLQCSVLDPSGQVIAGATGGSPLTVGPVAVTSGTYTVRVRRTARNVSFTLTVTHP